MEAVVSSYEIFPERGSMLMSGSTVCASTVLQVEQSYKNTLKMETWNNGDMHSSISSYTEFYAECLV